MTDNGEPVTWLNELEWIDGEVWANIWQTDCIAKIDPVSGRVTAWVLLDVRNHPTQPNPTSRLSAKRRSAVSDGGEDQGAEEAFWGIDEGEESSRQFWEKSRLARAALPFAVLGGMRAGPC